MFQRTVRVVEDAVNFVSNMLMEIMGNALFESAPVLDRAHRADQKPEKTGLPLCPFVVRFDSKKKNGCCDGLGSTHLPIGMLP